MAWFSFVIKPGREEPPNTACSGLGGRPRDHPPPLTSTVRRAKWSSRRLTSRTYGDNNPIEAAAKLGDRNDATCILFLKFQYCISRIFIHCQLEFEAKVSEFRFVEAYDFIKVRRGCK